MKVSAPTRVALAAILSSLPSVVAAISPTAAADQYNAWNKVFLHENSTFSAYYNSIPGGTYDSGWTNAYDLYVPQDQYFLNADNATQQLVGRLCDSFLVLTSPNDTKLHTTNWTSDGYNDDLGWYSIAMSRCNSITGNATYLYWAQAAFDTAFSRGWNTTYNDGGIWENMPVTTKTTKQGLSNDSLGKAACLIYQATHDASYLNKAQQIYTWVTSHLFNTATGQVYNDIGQDGTVNTKDKLVYNQGTFIGYANILYKITGDTKYYNHAKLALDFGKNNCSQGTTVQIFADSLYEHQGWADEYARYGAEFIQENGLWGQYYTFFSNNAEAVINTRRTDLNITWNNWLNVTSRDPVHKDGGWTLPERYAGAVAWLQFTPNKQPTSKIPGVHTVTNKQSGLVLDSADAWGNGKPVLQNTKAAQSTQAQRWQFTQNAGDGTWNIINLSTWQAIQWDSMRNAIVQWKPSRVPAQRWIIDEQADGSLKITNSVTGLVLDGGSNPSSGSMVTQSKSTGASSQLWSIA